MTLLLQTTANLDTTTRDKHRRRQIELMIAAENFFHWDFPRHGFRALLFEEASAEHDDWERKCLLQDMSVLWSDGEIFDWHSQSNRN